MAWLLKDGEPVAHLEVAESRREKRRGLLGRDGIEGALLLEPGRSVHTFGMRFPIDVVFCDRARIVLAIRTLRTGRITWPMWSARSIVEAEAGSAERWGLVVGDELELMR